MEGYVVRKRTRLGDTEAEVEAATDRRVTENHYPSDDNPYDSLYPVENRRPAVLRCLHAIEATRFHQTRSWVVSFLILRSFGPSRGIESRCGPNRLKFGPETTHRLL